MKTNYQVQGNIALITLDYPPVNGLGSELRQNILKHQQDAVADDKVKAIVIHSTQRVFCGGADISEFGTPKALEEPALPILLDALEESPKIIVAAIDGMALGGGFELTMVCDYRIASMHSALGLPEINLGILPGAGGTQRLPRLIGVPDALDMILTGKARDAQRMYELGAIDKLSEKNGEAFLVEAIQYAEKLVADGAPVRTAATEQCDTKGIDKQFFDSVRAGIKDRTRGFYAPERCIQAVEAAVNSKTLAEGQEVERKLFMECMNTPQARAQQHIFFAQRMASKVPGIAKDTAPVPHPVKKVAIIGSGTMGGGIAMNFANVGIPTLMLDINQEALDKGLGVIRKNYERTVAKKRLSPEDAEQRMACLSTTVDYAELKDVDLVIEAALETMSIKEKVFAELDKHCKAEAVLATNTSTLDIDQIASATKRPDKVLGMHFFSPANVMRLLEIVRTDKTSDESLLAALVVAKTIKKTAIVARNSWGFIGNRMLEPYGRESARLLLEGASPVQMDAAMREYGMAMGFPSMIDLAGIDIGYLIREGKQDAFYKHDPSYAAIADKLYELGRYGQKTGRGFYIYDGAAPAPDPEIEQLCEELAEKFDIKRRTVSDEEVVERSMYALINEGAKVLEEGIAERASDIDVAYCFGYGFPVFRGGPMCYANEIGADKVLDGLLRYRDASGEYGQHWLQPSKLLEELASKKSRF